MTHDNAGPSKQKSDLRRRAEKIARDRQLTVVSGPKASDAETVHDLQVHQIELELQNEELRRTEAELQASHDLFADLFDFAPIGYVTIDMDSHFVTANQTACRMFGTTRKELLKTRLSKFISPTDSRAFYFCLKQASEKFETSTCELKMLRQDGSEFTAELRIKPEPEADGQSSGYRIATTDISEAKKATETLRQQNELIRNLYATMNEGLALHEIIYDETGQANDYRIIEVNPAYEKITGLNRDQALGKKASELYGTGAPPYFDIYERVTRTGKAESFEAFFAPMGKHFNISVFSPEKGRFATIFSDITEPKKAEANKALLTGILQILNRDDTLYSITTDVLTLIRSVTGFDSVGLRLRQGDDFPYFVADGFSDKFLREENFLCARGGDGAILRDAQGMFILECTCGLVMSGGTDPSMSCFTPGGSFWTNNSSELLALRPEDDPRINPRNRCIHTGYESVGLFPVIAGTEIVGILQLNGNLPGQFTLEQVNFYENVAKNIGLAIQRINAESALKRSEQKFKLLWDSGNDIVLFLNEDLSFAEVNNRACEVLGYNRQEFLKMGTWDIDDPAVRTDQEALRKILRDKGQALFEETFVSRDGRHFNVEINAKSISIDGRNMYLAVARDITERKLAEQALKRMNAELDFRVKERTGELETANAKLVEQLELRTQAERSLRSLSSRLLTIQEEERRSIARELHDEVGQNLTVLKLMLGRAGLIANEEIKPWLINISGTVSEVLKQVRNLSMSLRPGVLDELGIVLALESLFKQLQSQTGLPIRSDFQDPGKLPPDLGITLYRVTQEAMTNILRHAGAHEVIVKLGKQDHQLWLSIKDDGHGFDQTVVETNRSTGLSAMKERTALVGGRFTIESEPGKGTLITVTIPLVTSAQ